MSHFPKPYSLSNCDLVLTIRGLRNRVGTARAKVTRETKMMAGTSGQERAIRQTIVDTTRRILSVLLGRERELKREAFMRISPNIQPFKKNPITGRKRRDYDAAYEMLTKMSEADCVNSRPRLYAFGLSLPKAGYRLGAFGAVSRV